MSVKIILYVKILVAKKKLIFRSFGHNFFRMYLFGLYPSEPGLQNEGTLPGNCSREIFLRKASLQKVPSKSAFFP